MNSINNIEYLNQIINRTASPIKYEEIDQFQIAYVVKKEDVHHLLSVLKSEGWKQLSYLSAIDWIDELKFEVVYILFNWEKPVYIQIRTKIDRENPVMDSIIPIFPGAKYYEREVHEFFGIKFPGNPDYEKQLILEEWDDIPPLRKDFDPKSYSDRKFPKRDYPQDYSKKDPKNNRLAKREARKARATSLRTKGGYER